jgi:hypothetical protein
MSHGGTMPVAPIDYVKLWVVARSFVLFYLFCGKQPDLRRPRLKLNYIELSWAESTSSQD